MLVIRRRTGECFLIGDNIEIEVLDIGATQVKLGIRAPREVAVLRKEVRLTWEANRAAAQDLAARSVAALVARRRSETPARNPAA